MPLTRARAHVRTTARCSRLVAARGCNVTSASEFTTCGRTLTGSDAPTRPERPGTYGILLNPPTRRPRRSGDHCSWIELLRLQRSPNVTPRPKSTLPPSPSGLNQPTQPPARQSNDANVDEGTGGDPPAETLERPESLYLRLSGVASTILAEPIYWQTVGSLAHAFASTLGVTVTSSVAAMNVPMMAAKTNFFMILLRNACSLSETYDLRSSGAHVVRMQECISVQTSRQRVNEHEIDL